MNKESRIWQSAFRGWRSHRLVRRRSVIRIRISRTRISRRNSCVPRHRFIMILEGRHLKPVIPAILMRDEDITSRWSDPERRQRLQDSFAYIAAWADESVVGILPPQELRAIKSAAIQVQSSLQSGVNLKGPLSNPLGLRRDLQLLIDFERVLRARPTDDPHRTDPQLRTAIRRASQLLCAEGADCQFC
jgi:hypothetical protein